MQIFDLHTLVFHQCSKLPQCIYILFLTIFDQFFVLSVLNFSLFENLNFTFDETKEVHRITVKPDCCRNLFFTFLSKMSTLLKSVDQVVKPRHSRGPFKSPSSVFSNFHLLIMTTATIKSSFFKCVIPQFTSSSLVHSIHGLR